MENEKPKKPENSAESAAVRPPGFARRLREKLALLLIVALPIPVSIGMISAGYFFKIPQLMDWGAMGLKVGAIGTVIATNLLLFAQYSQKGD